MPRSCPSRLCPKVNLTLLPLKIVLFCWHGAHSALIPYMTVHIKELGLTVEETAIIFTLLPITQLVCTPLAGMVADKLGRYKDVLMLSVLASVAFATAILFIPPVPEMRVEDPDITLHCGPVIVPHMEVEKCWDGPCDVFREHEGIMLEITTCSVFCDGTKDFDHTPINEVCRNDTVINNSTLLSNETMETDGKSCHFSNYPELSLSDTNYSLSMKFSEAYPHRDSCEYQISGVSPWRTENDTVTKDCTDLSCLLACPVVIHGNSPSCSVTCSLKQVPAVEVTYNGTLAPDQRRCVRHTTGNWYLTFWLYLVLRIFFNIFVNVCLTLLDATALAMVNAHGGHYGRQRFWAILAQAVFSLVTGYLVDLLSQHRGYRDYSPAFHSYNVLAVCTAIALWVMSVDVPPPAEHVLKNFRKLLRVPPMIVLMIVIFWLGGLYGFVESYLFWYLTDMGSPTVLLGLTLTTGAIVGLPFLHKANWFVKKVGQVNLLLLAFFFYFVRFFGYSYINNPWWCFPFEAMEAFTYHLMWVAAVQYSADLAPPGLLATIQGCIGGLHYGVGRGAGTFIGGTLMSLYGTRLAFRVIGISGGVMLFLYGFLYYCWLRKYDVERLHANEANAVHMNDLPVNLKSDEIRITEEAGLSNSDDMKTDISSVDVSVLNKVEKDKDVLASASNGEVSTSNNRLQNTSADRTNCDL